MWKKIIFGLIFLTNTVCGTLLCAAETKGAAATHEVGNKICPVSGEKIKIKEKGKIAYNGKIYNLCCQMCEKDFKKDPQKYIDSVSKEMKEEGK